MASAAILNNAMVNSHARPGVFDSDEEDDDFPWDDLRAPARRWWNPPGEGKKPIQLPSGKLTTMENHHF